MKPCRQCKEIDDRNKHVVHQLPRLNRAQRCKVTNKVSFDTESQAEEVIFEQWALSNYGICRSYLCKHCKKWHLTSKTREYAQFKK